MLWTRLVLKESELRENWERLYWDEEYSKKLGEDRANYLSLEDDDEDFSPYMNRPFDFDQLKILYVGQKKFQLDKNWMKYQFHHIC
ncbi:hypothetical protein UlMin_027553 [Ulmus minor]